MINKKFKIRKNSQGENNFYLVKRIQFPYKFIYVTLGTGRQTNVA
jgi:hypothetical protein